MNFSKNSKDASRTPFSCAKHGDKNKKIWESKCGHMYVHIYIYMRAGGFAQKYGVGILLNKRWKKTFRQRTSAKG